MKIKMPSQKEIRESLRCEYCGEHGHSIKKCEMLKQDKEYRIRYGLPHRLVNGFWK